MNLTTDERMELQRHANARDVRAHSARHARLILLLAKGLAWAEFPGKLDCPDNVINRWSQRFETDRLAGLLSRHAVCSRYKMTNRLEAEILAWTNKRKPADGSTHWSVQPQALSRTGGRRLAHDGGSGLGQGLPETASARRLRRL